MSWRIWFKIRRFCCFFGNFLENSKWSLLIDQTPHEVSQEKSLVLILKEVFSSEVTNTWAANLYRNQYWWLMTPKTHPLPPVWGTDWSKPLWISYKGIVWSLGNGFSHYQNIERTPLLSKISTRHIHIHKLRCRELRLHIYQQALGWIGRLAASQETHSTPWHLYGRFPSSW